MHLIYIDDTLEIRKGGPSGYLSNLKEGLELTKDDKIKFIYSQNTTLKHQFGNKLKKILPPSIFLKIKQIKEKASYKSLNNNLQNWHINLQMSDQDINYIKEHFSEIKSIHCHYTEDFVKVSNTLELLGNNKILQILTSHSPEACFEQYYASDVIKFGEEKADLLKPYRIEIDRYAFEKADVIIFPSKDALEPYYQTWNDFSEIIRNKDIRFVYTGCKPLNSKIDRDTFRKSHGITEKDFVISYVGRHESIKGYDQLQLIAKELWKKGINIKFLIGGIISNNIPPLVDKRWIEIGWTNDPGSLIGASDLFILPNKRTYFDLIMLEVMSMGTPIIGTYTGGNKTVSSISAGVHLYNDVNECVKVINHLFTNKKELEEMGSINKDIYEKFFTIKQFALNYKKVMKDIYGDYRLK